MSQTSHAETAGLQRLTRKGQATRDRIVESAAGLMFRQGVAGTTTEQVQAAAGVSASQIFHYFGDKRALVRAVIAYQTEAVLTAQQPLGRLDSMEALRAWAALESGDTKSAQPSGFFTDRRSEQIEKDLGGGF